MNSCTLFLLLHHMQLTISPIRANIET